MFDVVDDKPEGFIMYKHKPVGRGFIHYRIIHERVYPRAILHEGFYNKIPFKIYENKMNH